MDRFTSKVGNMISILTRWYHGKWISWENLSISHYFSEYGYHGENYDQPRFICAASLFSETRTWGFSYIKAWDLSKKNRRNSSWFNHQPFCIKTAEFQDFGRFWSILKRGIAMHYILFLVTWSGTILTVFDHGMGEMDVWPRALDVRAVSRYRCCHTDQ